MAEGVPVHFETQSGVSSRFFEVHAYPEPEGLAVYLRDITEHKKAEDALRESEEKYRNLYETMDEGFALGEMIFDEAGKPIDYIHVEVNSAFERLIGLSRDRIIGKTIRSILPNVSAKAIESFGKVVLTGEPVHFENYSRDLDRWYQIIGYKSGSNQFAYFAIDVTEQKRTAKERQRLMNELAERVAELNAVLDTAPIAIWIAHDLQCRKITGNAYADRILQAPSGSNISRSALPREAAVFYKTFRNGVELQPEELPAQIAASGKPVNGAELGLVFPDGRRVNLLASAVPFIDAEGHVRGSVTTGADVTQIKLAAEALKKARDELELRVQERTAELNEAKENLEVINEKLRVEISEHEKTEKELMAAKEAAEAAVEAKAAFLANMSHELRTPLNAVIGFSSLLLDDSLTRDQKEYLERIRNGGEALLGLISDILEFSRAEKEKIKLEHQLLSLKRIIEESMGMVAVQANDKGLNLAYTIAYGTPYGNLSAQKPMSILVAEDNPSNQRVLVEMLKRLGYRPDAVADGLEVLQALQIRPYDLIFMDIQMPELDGLAATKEIRKLWPDNGPKIVAVTAFAMEGDREKCFGAGADDCIAKPVKVGDLATLLRNITSPKE